MTSASTYSETESTPADEIASEAAVHVALQNEAALNSLPERQPAEFASSCYLHGHEVAADEVTVIVSQAALEQIAVHSNSNLQCELGGVLLGRPYKFEDRLYLDVIAAIPAVTDDHGPVHFTFTADAWSQLHKDRLAQYPALDIVGWFHTHPDLGVFYSSDDVVVHSAAFTLPWHVGLVVDPVRQETSFFGWQQSTLVAYPGFYELLDKQAEPILPWRAVRTEVWDHAYEHEFAERPYQSEVYLPASRMPGFPATKPYWGFVVGVLGLLLSFFLLVGWVVPLTQKVNRLENTVIVVADKALADSNAALCPDYRLRILSPVNGQRFATNETVEILGTAVYPDANRYQVSVRPMAGEEWLLINSPRRDMKLGQLAQWDTTIVPPGAYELRLTAVDRNNIRLSDSPPCAIALELGG